MLNINRWFTKRYLRHEETSLSVPTDAHILAQLNARIDRKRYQYKRVLEIKGYIVPVLRHTKSTDFCSVDLVHVAENGTVTELDAATMVEDNLGQFLPAEIMKQCNERQKEETE